MLFAILVKAFPFAFSLFLIAPQQPAVKAFAGHWEIPGNLSSSEFRSPAFGPEIDIEISAETITLKYSLKRQWTLRLDGTELKQQYLLADVGTYDEIASVRVQNGGITLSTSRNPRGIVSREERVLHLNGNSLTVEGRRWVDGKLLNTSKLTYQRK